MLCNQHVEVKALTPYGAWFVKRIMTRAYKREFIIRHSRLDGFFWIVSL